MKSKKEWIGTLIAAILVLAVFAVTSVNAQPTNGGFELGNTNGWSESIPLNGSIDVVTSYLADKGLPGEEGPTYTPVAGTYFAVLKTNGAGSYTTLSQTIALSAGQTIKGYAAYDARDYLPALDPASVEIYDSSDILVATPWSENVSTVGDHGESDWTYWEWTAPAADSYTLQLKIANCGDSKVDSRALFDWMIVTDVIPEFSTIALPVATILGLLFFFNYRKRRNE